MHWTLVAGVNPVDFKVRGGAVMGFIVARPKIPGGDLAGVIEKGVGRVRMATHSQNCAHASPESSMQDSYGGACGAV